MLDQVIITAQRTQLAQHLFPEEWARMEETLRGERRRRKRQALRNRAEWEVVMMTLRNRGATCATCLSATKPSHLNPPSDHTRSIRCDILSDYYGDIFMRPEDLCTRWKAKEADAA